MAQGFKKAIILLDVHGEEYMKSTCGPVEYILEKQKERWFFAHFVKDVEGCLKDCAATRVQLVIIKGK